MLSSKRGLLDSIIEEMEGTAVVMKRAKKMNKKEDSNPYSASANFERGSLEYRDDDKTVEVPSVMDMAMTYNIPEPSPAYHILVKLAEAHEKVLPFETYWLHISKFTTLDLSLPVHMLAIYMVEACRGKQGLERVVRPFQELVGLL